MGLERVMNVCTPLPMQLIAPPFSLRLPKLLFPYEPGRSSLSSFLLDFGTKKKKNERNNSLIVAMMTADNGWMADLQRWRGTSA